MKFLYSLTGANIPVIKEFTIDKTATIAAGEVVVKDPDGVMGDSQIGHIVGIAAEDHSGQKDILNARADGDKLRIDITRGGVYEIDAVKTTAISESNETSLVTNWIYLNSTLAGGLIVLLKKGEGSENTDEIGCVRAIEGDSIANTKCNFSVSEGGKICAGDVYAILPPVGFVGRIDGNRHDFIPSGGLNAKVKVVFAHTDTCKLDVVIDYKTFD